LTATKDSSWSMRFSWSRRILSEIYCKFWCYCTPSSIIKKEGFTWTTTATDAFDALKKALTTASDLQLPDFDKSFIMDCDALGSGFGAILHQQDGLMAFYSRAIAPQHVKLTSYERELIGFVEADRHWRPYLWGRSFIIRIDHYNLKFLLDHRLSTISQHIRVSKLFGYDF
jgi:hypothetical protein